MATSAVSYCNHLSSRVTIPAARGSKLFPHSFENRKKLHAPALPGSVAPDCHSCRKEDGAAASIVGHRNSTILISQAKKRLGRATCQGIRRQNIWCNSQRELAELAQEKMMMKLDGSPTDERLSSLKFCRCPSCGRRGLVAGLIGGFASSMDKKAFGASDFRVDEYNKIIEAVHPGRGAWYEGFFARVMESGMDSYEAMVASYKSQLFEMLDDSTENVLELGIGTGPNLKYYGNKPRIQKVVGVDPNLQMAKFCSAAALRAGLAESQFEFIHGVGEIIPLPDASIDAVVSTLVLCSVSNVTSTLKEVKRVLKPGGSFLFIEHVAAPEGNGLRRWQRVFDPLQQLFADGCHLTRDTLEDIKAAKFKSVEAERFTLPGLFVIGPHISGVAHTADL